MKEESGAIRAEAGGYRAARKKLAEMNLLDDFLFGAVVTAQKVFYGEDTTYGNAVNEDLRELHGMVETVKRDRKVIQMRMRIVEDMIRQAEQITKLEDKTTKQAEEIAKQSKEIVKQAEEIKRLREQLAKVRSV